MPLAPKIFTHDAVWRELGPVDLQFKALKAIREGIPASLGKTEYLIQFATGILVEWENEAQATVRSHLAELGRSKNPANYCRPSGFSGKL